MGDSSGSRAGKALGSVRESTDRFEPGRRDYPLENQGIVSVDARGVSSNVLERTDTMTQPQTLEALSTSVNDALIGRIRIANSKNQELVIFHLQPRKPVGEGRKVSIHLDRKSPMQGPRKRGRLLITGPPGRPVNHEVPHAGKVVDDRNEGGPCENEVFEGQRRESVSKCRENLEPFGDVRPYAHIA